jgi:ABC-type nitrate/sulfonate/bicarbonate transport system substrate-binding protein
MSIPLPLSRPHPSRRRFLGTAAALSGLVLTDACADRGGSSDPMTLNIGQVSNSVAFLPLFIAKQEGYFNQQGVKIGAQTILGTGAKVSAALVGRSVDLGASVMTDVFSLAKAGRSPKIIASLVDEFYVDIISAKGFPAPGGDLIAKVKALRGKKIGITGPGSGTEALVIYLFKLAGMDSAKDAELVNLGSEATSALGALKNHRVDALSFAQPIGQAAEASGIGTIYISPARGDIPAMSGQAHGVVFTTDDVLKKKRKAIDGFVTAIAKAEKLIHSDEAKTRTLLAAYQKTLSAQTVSSMVPILEKEIPQNPALSQAGFQKAVAFHKQSGLISTPPPYSSVTESH